MAFHALALCLVHVWRRSYGNLPVVEKDNDNLRSVARQELKSIDKARFEKLKRATVAMDVWMTGIFMASSPTWREGLERHGRPPDHLRLAGVP